MALYHTALDKLGLGLRLPSLEGSVFVFLISGFFSVNLIVKALAMNLFSKLTQKIITWMGGGTNSARVLANLQWLVADRFIRAIFGFIISVLVTRYLGPDYFGTLSYAVAYVGIFAAFAGLGLETIVIREIAKDVSKKNVLLGTAFFLKSTASVFALICIIVSILISDMDHTTKILVAIVAGGLFFNGWDVVDYWFQSQVQSRFNVIARNISNVLSILIRLILVLSHAPLLAFAIATAVDTLLTAAALAIAYLKTSDHIREWKIEFLSAKALVKESWPLMLSAFAITVYMRVDQIILGNFGGSHSVGIYAAAVKLSEIWYFIPMAISSSIFPVLVAYRKKNEQLFYSKFQKYSAVLAAISIGIAIVTTLFSGNIIHLIYGSRYSESGPVLALYIWAGIFVFIGVAASNWAIIENRQKVLMYATFAGAVSNVVLNIILIPQYYEIGAAIATIFGQAVAGYFIYFVFPESRKVAIISTKSLFFSWKYLF